MPQKPSRKTATAMRERRVFMVQMAEGYVKELPGGGYVLLCACGCGAMLGPNTDITREHVIPLFMGGADEYFNIRLYLKTCADKKTFGENKATTAGSDIANIAKVKRLRGETGQRKYKQKIQSPGFRKDIRRRMDGTVERRT